MTRRCWLLCMQCSLISRSRAQTLIAVHTKVANNNPCCPEEQALYDALEESFGKRSVTTKLFGVCAHRLSGDHIEGYLLTVERHSAANANLITVKRTT